MPSSTDKQIQEDVKDLGFGTKVVQESKLRLLNRDGTFNVSRKGLSFFQSLNLYQILLNMSWLKFNVCIFSAYLLISLIFAVAYFLSGTNTLLGATGTTVFQQFLEAFFFSIHTITTVGFGHIAPKGYVTNFVVVLETFIGLSGFAVAAGLVFARFSRPVAKILFSDKAVVGPHHGVTSFKFRIANGSRIELIEVEVRILLCITEIMDRARVRRFYQLPLERNKVAFFPLDWTIAHPITEKSPLFGTSIQDLCTRDAEFLILINAIDDSLSQPVHARSSYKWNDIIWGARFIDMYRETKDGQISIDLKRLHDIQHVEIPSSADQTLWDF